MSYPPPPGEETDRSRVISFLRAVFLATKPALSCSCFPCPQMDSRFVLPPPPLRKTHREEYYFFPRLLPLPLPPLTCAFHSSLRTASEAKRKEEEGRERRVQPFPAQHEIAPEFDPRCEKTWGERRGGRGGFPCQSSFM